MILTKNTKIIYNGAEKAVLNGVNILSRDIDKKFADTDAAENKIILTENSSLGAEEFLLDVADDITVSAADDLGFVYGLLYISEKFLGIEPFWFWFDQKIEKVNSAEVTRGLYKSRKPAVKYRGWFINDEVLIMKWAVNGDSEEPWRMALEALLRCGGNMVIPGTDKNSRLHRQTAVDMGLWITHHHAEPLGAEMFARVYPDLEPNYLEYSDLFMKLWEESVIEQKDDKTIWCLGFRGQGDCPFWSHDTSGRFDTDEKRGKLISDVIELQRQLVLKYVDNPVFCTNLYGEIMELYEAGHITFAPDIIKISADNGFGKMVTRRRDGHTVRISSMPEKPVEHGGIYYHVSFYDLQAANHITMFPNSVAFADSELSEVIDKNMSDYWLINCSNVRPHAYFLDVVRRKWYGEDISDELCSKQFADTYFGGNEDIADLYRDYHKYMTPFGTNEDEHAGEQFYTELIRIITNAVYKNLETVHGLDWISGKKPIREQVKIYSDIIKSNLDNLTALYDRCKNVSQTLSGDIKQLFDTTMLLHATLLYLAGNGVSEFGDGFEYYSDGEFKKAFMCFGKCAKLFKEANDIMRQSEYGIWEGFYFNDCFADFKHTAYMAEKMMSMAREKGDSASHVKWYRDAVYAKEDRKIMTLLVNDNHMTDWELYDAFEKNV